MKKMLIKNGRVCLGNTIEKCDLLIVNGKIASIDQDHAAVDETVDAAGMYVLPGFIDMHTHVDDTIGGFELADTYESATRLAVQNGITTIYSFVTQSSDETLGEAVHRVCLKAEGNTHCHVGWHLTPTHWDDDSWEEVLHWVPVDFRTLKLYTTYREAGLYSSYERIKSIAEKLKDMGVTILVHCEDEAELDIHLTEIDMSDPFSHTLMRPPAAEHAAIAQVIRIARETGVRFHIVHVSTAEGVEMIRDNRSTARITCETAPHYLFLNEETLRGEEGHYYLCSPPLRSEYNRERLVRLAREGCIDVYATDHCAFAKRHKDMNRADLRRTPKGIAGLGALVPLMYEMHREKGASGMLELSQRLSANPARVTGLYPKKGVIEPGADADLVICEDGGEKRRIVSSLSDTYEPYPDFSTTLRVHSVCLNGEWAVHESRLVGSGVTHD